MTYRVSDNERTVLHEVMRQAEHDLKSAHAEICKLQNLDLAKHEWPEWSSQANSLRWFDAIREKFPAPQCADCGYPLDNKPVFLGGCWFCSVCNPAISHLDRDLES